MSPFAKRGNTSAIPRPKPVLRRPSETAKTGDFYFGTFGYYSIGSDRHRPQSSVNAAVAPSSKPCATVPMRPANPTKAAHDAPGGTLAARQGAGGLRGSRSQPAPASRDVANGESPPAPGVQRGAAGVVSRVRARRSRAPWRPLTRPRRRAATHRGGTTIGESTKMSGVSIGKASGRVGPPRGVP